MASKKAAKPKTLCIIGPGDYVVVRSYAAGVHAGRVARISEDGARVDLVDARHCWAWSGQRLTADDIANVGARSSDKWSGSVAATTLPDAVSIHLATTEAEASIVGAPVSAK